ncbi:protein FAM91 homolog isoform X2 [Gordionus sp. m RMFG-2023]
MNRLQGDSVENLLYSIFAVLDPSLNVSRLADHVLDLEKELVIRGVSLLNRLGLAVPYHITAYPHTAVYSPNDEMETPSLEGDISLDSFIENLNISDAENKTKGSSEQDSSPSMKSNPYDVLPTSVKKIGLVFDSMLAAFLMMGNLSQGLKTHAITMFETGKLPWESLQDFLKLLEQVDIEACLNDDIKIYANVSQALKNTLMVLISTFSPSLSPSCLAVNVKTNYTNIHGLDMLKCESFTQLNRTTCDRILEKYETIIYISPISQSVCPILNLDIPIFGPCMPEMKTPWFRLFLYYVFQNGPVSLLLRRGTRLTRLPNIFKVSQFLSLSTWEHEPIVIPMNSSLLAINDALTSYPLLIQPYPVLDQAQSNDNYLIYLNSLQSDASNIDANDSKNPAISDSLPKNDDKHPILDHTFPFGKDNFNNAATADLKHLSRFKYFKHSLGYIRCIKLPVLSATNKDWLLQLPVKPLIEEDLEKSLWDASDRLMSNESIYENEHSKGYEWCFYDCNLGIPLSDLVLNNQILTLIKSNEPFNNENLRELKMATNIFSQCFLQFMKNCQYFDHTSIPLDTEELIFPGKERDKYKDFSYPRNNLLIYRNKVLLWEI